MSVDWIPEASRDLLQRYRSLPAAGVSVKWEVLGWPVDPQESIERLATFDPGPRHPMALTNWESPEDAQACVLYGFLCELTEVLRAGDKDQKSVNMFSHHLNRSQDKNYWSCEHTKHPSNPNRERTAIKLRLPAAFRKQYDYADALQLELVSKSRNFPRQYGYVVSSKVDADGVHCNVVVYVRECFCPIQGGELGSTLVVEKRTK